MRSYLLSRALVGGAAFLMALGFIVTVDTPLIHAEVPVVSMKPLIAIPMWQLDITWHAKDTYEDQDRSAKLDMTATARFILKQSDRRDDWGRWHVESLDSSNLALTGSLINKNDHSRTEYKNNLGLPADGGVTFQVGGLTPGYQLDVGVAFPIKITNPLIGSMDSLQTLLTSDVDASPSVFCTGPLPVTGDTISGSLVIPAPVGPFVGSTPPKTRVAIQFVLKPFDTLAPLTPVKK